MDDIRDMSDPAFIGQLIRTRDKSLYPKATDILDALLEPWSTLPRYEPPPSIQEQETLKYQTYLREETAKGNVHTRDLTQENHRPVHTPQSRAFFARAQETLRRSGIDTNGDLVDPDPGDATGG